LNYIRRSRRRPTSDGRLGCPCLDIVPEQVACVGDPRRGRATAQLGSSPDGQDQPSNGARRLATSALGTPGHGGPGHLAGSTLTRQRTDRPGTLKACGDISDSGLLPTGDPHARPTMVSRCDKRDTARSYLNFSRTDRRLVLLTTSSRAIGGTQLRHLCGNDKSTPCLRRVANYQTRGASRIPDHHGVRRCRDLDAVTARDTVARLAPYARIYIEGRHIGMLPRIRIAGTR